MTGCLCHSLHKYETKWGLFLVIIGVNMIFYLSGLVIFVEFLFFPTVRNGNFQKKTFRRRNKMSVRLMYLFLFRLKKYLKIIYVIIFTPSKVEFEKTIAWIKKPSRHPSLIVKISKQSSCNCIFHQYIIRLVIYRPLSTSHKKWQFELLVPFQNQFRRNRIFFFFLSSHPEFMIIIIYFFFFFFKEDGDELN